MHAATCGKCSARGLTWSRSPGGVVYLSDADGAEHWQTCAGVTAPDDVADAMPAPMPTAAPAPIVARHVAPVEAPVDLVADDDGADDVEALAAEFDDDERMREATSAEALAACDWPDLRRAILAYGGIGASPDFPRDWVPGDLYRINGKAPDLVAAEAVRGAPWGDTGDDSAMLDYLHRSWEQWQRAQAQRRPRPVKASARSVSEALAVPAPAKTGSAGDLRAVVYDVARLVADVADLVAAGNVPAGLADQVRDLARTIAEASA